MSEADIVSGLYPFFLGRNHEILVHNTTGALHYVGESDFITINRTGFITEVEIKISRGDYKNDFTKKLRHKHLSGTGYYRERKERVDGRSYILKENVKEHGKFGRMIYARRPYQIDCIEIKKIHVKPSESIPNYFYYAFPEGLVKREEVPPYCGILEMRRVETEARIMFEVKEVRKPRRFHTRKATDKQKVQILRSQMYRVIDSVNRSTLKPGWT